VFFNHRLKPAAGALLLAIAAAAGCGAPAEGTDGAETPLVIGTTPDAGTATDGATSLETDSTASSADADEKDVDNHDSTVTDTATEGDTSLEADSTASSADADEKDVDDHKFFSLDALHTVHITLGEAQIDALWDQPYEWVVGDVVVDGVAHEQIGVRLKGKLGSFRDLDQKSAFLLKFNHTEAGHDLHGMKKLALNNMVQDRSLVHELLSYTLFRAADVPAPRVAYARVLVNWELYGLYLAVESPNNEHFLEDWFEGEDKGALYEGEYGQDLFVDSIPGFDQDEGTQTDKLDLYALVQALDWMDMEGDIPAQLGALFDLERYLALAATEIGIGHWDGYAWTRNNFYLYQPTPESLWTFMPWGTDQTFNDHLEPFGGAGRVEQICVTSPACRELLGEAFLTTVDHMTTLELGALALKAHALIWDAAVEDPRREYNEADMAAALGHTIAYLALRPASILEGLACLDPTTGDDDGDGHSSCFGVDCDDGDPTIYPGAEEVCNFRDDDCDGHIDEVQDGETSCPTCETLLTDDIGSVLLCRVAKNYAEAHEACLSRGADLLSIHSEEQQLAIGEAAYANYAGHLWIGINDLETEGTYAWTDGSPLDYENWNDGEPNDWGAGEDCGHLYEGNGNKWNDLPCNHQAGYLCRVPDLALP